MLSLYRQRWASKSSEQWNHPGKFQVLNNKGLKLQREATLLSSRVMGAPLTLHSVGCSASLLSNQKLVNANHTRVNLVNLIYLWTVYRELRVMKIYNWTHSTKLRDTILLGKSLVPWWILKWRWMTSSSRSQRKTPLSIQSATKRFKQKLQSWGNKKVESLLMIKLFTTCWQQSGSHWSSQLQTRRGQACYHLIGLEKITVCFWPMKTKSIMFLNRCRSFLNSKRIRSRTWARKSRTSGSLCPCTSHTLTRTGQNLGVSDWLSLCVTFCLVLVYTRFAWNDFTI